ncbi:helix-turn-helix domain-containing protein [Streptomyces sp. NPDC059783]|uniref:helix-turn-helix domain-containing protein n=1 Tax=Streptomyces sp. NPDC059783 TaxID=3346944 RepID=UPI003655E96A
MSALPRLHTADDVAEALQVSPWWVKEQARRGRIAALKVGGAWRFTAAQVDQIIQMSVAEPSEPAPEPAAPRRTRNESPQPPLQLVAKLPRRAVI